MTKTLSTRVYTPTVSLLRISGRRPYTLYATAGTALYRSENLGDRWTRLSLNVKTGIEALAVADGHVYVFTHAGRLFRSLDGGTQWDDLSTTLPQGAIPWSYLDKRLLVVHPTRPDVIYVGGGFASPPPYPNYNRLYVSRDGGTHWQDLSSSLPTGRVVIKDLYISPQLPHRLWLLMEDTRYRRTPGAQLAQRVFISDDQGVTWRELHLDPRIRQAGIRMLLLMNSHQLYVATAGYGVWSWNFTHGWTSYLPSVSSGNELHKKR